MSIFLINKNFFSDEYEDTGLASCVKIGCDKTCDTCTGEETTDCKSCDASSHRTLQVDGTCKPDDGFYECDEATAC